MRSAGADSHHRLHSVAETPQLVGTLDSRLDFILGRPAKLTSVVCLYISMNVPHHVRTEQKLPYVQPQDTQLPILECTAKQTSAGISPTVGLGMNVFCTLVASSLVAQATGASVALMRHLDTCDLF
jgi:hypothetical protein